MLTLLSNEKVPISLVLIFKDMLFNTVATSYIKLFKWKILLIEMK